MKRQRLLQRACLVMALAAGAAAPAVAWTGGFDFTFWTVRVRGHDPDRLAFLACTAAAGFFLSGGRIRLPRWWSRIHPSHVVVALAVVIAAIGLTFGSRVVGGSDSYGYVSQAHLWLTGQLSQPQPWANEVPWPSGGATFQPLGYVASSHGAMLVPIYSPGLPLVMAAAMLVGGACAAFSVVPIAAAVAVVATYRIGRALGAKSVGLVAAWLLATSPMFLYMLVQPMSDIPATAAWLVAILLVLRPGVPSAFAAGLFAALVLLIRINLAPLAAGPFAWIAWGVWREWRASRRLASKPLVAFVAGFVPGVVAAATFNWVFHGSPMRSGYGTNEELFALANMWPNLTQYAAWLTETQTPLIWVGVTAALLPLRCLWPDSQARVMAVCLAVALVIVGVEYCLYAVFDAWWYLRFFLPLFPIFLIAFAQVGQRLVRGRGRIVHALWVGIVLALGVHGATIARDRFAFALWKGETRYAAAGRVVGAVTEPGSVIFSMQHSGSLRHYAGRMTLRYDFLDPMWLDRSVTWLSERGVHAYAMLDRWEIDAWRERFGDHSRLGRLDLNPIRVFDDSSGMALYDLIASGPGVPRRVAISPRDADCHAPAPPPAFSLRP